MLIIFSLILVICLHNDRRKKKKTNSQVGISPAAQKGQGREITQYLLRSEDPRIDY